MGKPHEVLGFRCAGKSMKTKCGSGRNVDGLSFWSDIVFRCFQFLWRESAKKLWCFFLPLRFLRPFCYSVQTRHVLLTILVWQYFGATIAIQN